MPRVLRTAMVVCAALSALFAPAAGADDSGTVTYTQASQQTYVVPPAVTRVVVTAIGAPGGAGANGSPGGSGAKAVATVQVTPGQTLYVFPGGAGNSASPTQYHLDKTDGGFNFGGYSSGNGG